MADGDIIGFDEATAKRVLDATLFYEHNPRYPLPVRKYGGPPISGVIFDCKLTSSLTAASPNGKTGATTATVRLWRPDPTDSHNPQQLIEDGFDTTIVNTTTDTASSGAHGFVAYINGRLQWLRGDC